MSRSPSPIEFGLVATGRSEAWRVDLDESLEGDEKWLMQIDGPSVYLNIEIAGPSVVNTAAAALDRCDAIRLGNLDALGVSLIPNGGGPRWCLLIGPESHACVRLTLPDEDIRAILEAFHQIQSQL